MAFKFEELKVWQKALELSNEIDIMAKEFNEIKKLNVTTMNHRL